MHDDYDHRIREVVSHTFNVPIERLDEGTRRGTLEEWDSLGHVNLVSALSEEFNVMLPPELALEIHTIGDIKRIVTALLT